MKILQTLEFSGPRRALGGILPALVVAVALVAPGPPALASGSQMEGPEARHSRHTPQERIETAAPRIVLDAAYRFFRERISPVDGDRCGFRPTCSAYAHRALSEKGFLTGLMLTGDRLIRCHPWKKAGADYTLLPNGRLHDPLPRNVAAGK